MKLPDSWMQTGPFVQTTFILDANIDWKTRKINFIRMTNEYLLVNENTEFGECLYIMPDGTVNS